MVPPNGSDLITSIVSKDACVNNGIAPGKYWSLTFWNFSDRNIGFSKKNIYFLTLCETVSLQRPDILKIPEPSLINTANLICYQLSFKTRVESMAHLSIRTNLWDK